MLFHSASQPTRFLAAALAGAVLLSSCASSTTIQSNPTGAKVYLNGEPVGVTPYTHTDTKIVGSTTQVRLEKDGYETLYTAFSRNEEADVGAIIGGVFLLVPFLWTMKYKPQRMFELKPSFGFHDAPLRLTAPPEVTTKAKADRLRELKKLFDEKLINETEYEREKQKILDEP